MTVSQHGEYLIEKVRDGDWVVRRDGVADGSHHSSEGEALSAVHRYQLADRRRVERERMRGT